MGFFGNDSEQYKAYNTVMNTPASHKAHLSHELIAGAAAYQAAKAYQEHCKDGKPPTHQKAKEIFAGLAAVAVTHIAETKGLDALDKHKAQKAAQDHAEHHIAKHY